jgi:murein DD-endopeptidase MepM/ murein hydrolase activator NlpD
MMCGTLAVSFAETDYDTKIAELEKKIERIAKENKDRLAKIDTYKDNAAEMETLKALVEEEMDALDVQIANQSELVAAKQAVIDTKIIYINELDNNIRKAERLISNAEAEIARLDAENAANIYRFGQIARGMYMSDGYDIVGLLAGSSDFYDLLVRSEVMANIGEQNKTFMDNLLATIDEQRKLASQLELQKQSLEKDKLTAEDEREVLNGELEKLNAEKRTFEAALYDEQLTLSFYRTKITGIKENIENLKSQFSASQNEQEVINTEITKLIKAKQAAEAAKNKPDYSGDGFLWPLDSRFHMITTQFGYDAWRGGNHYGIDVGDGGIGGANIYAAQSGTVITAYNDGGYHGGYGNYVVVDHGGGIATLYAHGKTGGIVVSVGDEVKKGDVISHVGATGWATGNHLHFEVRIDGVAVNPFSYSYEGYNP